MDEIKSTFKEYFEIAPQNIRTVIKTVSDKPEIIMEIARRQGLADNMVDALQVEIFLVLLGVEPFSSFRANLVQELDLTYDQALKISLDANIAIFGPIMETLKNMEQGIVEEKQAPSSNPVKTRPYGGDSAEDILRGQMDQKVPANIPTTPLLMDHEETEKVDGVHLHSQSVMPSASSTFSKPAPAPAPAPSYTPAPTRAAQPAPVQKPTQGPGIFRHTDAELPKSSLRSIVDEKLSSLVRSTNDSVSEKPKSYDGNDPYREPLQ